jgi:hypothetical protein
VEWRPSYRLVPSRFPPRGLFDRVASAEDLEAVLAVESLTNDRLRDEVGDITLVPPSERLTGPGATPVMAALTHPSPDGSRFADDRYGVFYGGRELETAVRETVHHREQFLADSDQPPMRIEMREYRVDVVGPLRDLRDNAAAQPLLDPDSYEQSRPFGVQEWEQGGYGIVYPSVRNPGGECVAVFRTPPLSPATQGRHYGYHWDGRQITDVVELRASHIEPHAD